MAFPKLVSLEAFHQFRLLRDVNWKTNFPPASGCMSSRAGGSGSCLIPKNSIMKNMQLAITHEGCCSSVLTAGKNTRRVPLFKDTHIDKTTEIQVC